MGTSTRRITLTFWMITLMIPFTAAGQQVFHFTVNQADVLIADAGAHQTVGTGIPLQLGGNPTSTGGTPPYQYLWQPGTGLSDSLAANPMLLPDSTRIYTLRVTDQAGCTAEQSVQITVITGIAPVTTAAACPCTISPNPLRGSILYLRCPLSDFSTRMLIVRTLSGTELMRRPISASTTAIDLSHTGFARGVLVVTITGATVNHHKIVVL
jgi:hypothetical protein